MITISSYLIPSQKNIPCWDCFAVSVDLNFMNATGFTTVLAADFFPALTVLQNQQRVCICNPSVLSQFHTEYIGAMPGHGISHCKRNYPLYFIDKHSKKFTYNLNILTQQIQCDGFSHPISFSDDTLSFSASGFWFCVDYKYFLHSVCTRELPGAMKLRPSHPKHMICLGQTLSKSALCDMCKNEFNGIFYECEGCFIMCINCASLPQKIRYESHKHTLKLSHGFKACCSACNKEPTLCSFYRCNIIAQMG
ncbi:hypothetical protein POM88_000898 [Heracleum sosnowskyi]|uniref:DC1 domain-containing protein n=1 Tax=Heracleum sosnowskyi TaxID=360622 RepID=A0AAD8JDV6_9APIA|nr:hypothetical protein POM88_000898 [Heracleum sosnowskyi]